MPKYLLFVILFIFSYQSILAQRDNAATGARAVAMSNASVTMRDHWALYNNIGGLAGVDQMIANFAYNLPYQVFPFQSFSVGFILPTSLGVAGLNLNRFGDELYSEQKIGLGFSHKIGQVSLGIKANYLQIYTQTIGSKNNLIFEFGGIADITQKLSFGAHVYNLNQGKLKAEYGNERLPVTMKAGLSYHPIEKIFINVETEKNINFAPTIKTGLEYQVVKYVALRTGISAKPFQNSFGIGFSPKAFSFDYAFSTHSQLGFSHHISLAYKLKRR